MGRLLAAIVLVVLTAGCTNWEIVAFYFGDHADQANDVVECESHHQADAVSPDGANHGMWQINNVHRRRFVEVTGQPWGEVYNPVHASRYARWLYDQTGDFSAWTCG